MEINTAVLTTVVKQTGVDKASAELDAYANKGVAAAAKFDQAFQRSAASAMDFARAGATANQISQLTGQSLASAREAVQRYGGQSAVAAGEVRGFAQAQREMAAAGVSVTQAAGRAGPSINSLRSAMTSLTASVLQTAPGVGQLSGVLGSMALGSGVMVGVLAGVAALGFAWNLLTKDAAEARKEHERLRDVLDDLVKKQKQGITGDVGAAVQDQHAVLDRLRREIATIRASQATAVANPRLGVDPELLYGNLLKSRLEDERKLVEAIRIGEEKMAEIVHDNQVKIVDETKRAASERQRIADDQRRAAEALAKSEREVLDATMSHLPTLKDTAVAYDKMAEATWNAARATEELLNKMKPGIKAAPMPSVIPDRSWDEVFFLPPIKAVDKYADDMRKIFRDGFGKIATDGFKSWQDMFEDILQLSSRLMDRMAQEGKASGFAGKALGIASAGIGGGIAAYQAGQSAGSPGMGALAGAGTGALAGAAIGSVVPVIGTAIGAIVGGLAGLTLGLIGGSKAARERAKAEAELAAQEKIRIAQIAEEMRLLRISFVEDLAVRNLRAAGLTEQADAYAQAIADARELTEAIKMFGAVSAEVASLQQTQAAEARARESTALLQKISDANQKQYADTLESLNAALAEQRRIREVAQQELDTQTEALNVAKSALDAQQRVVDEMRQQRDAIRKLSDGLKLNTGLSPLSPVQRYTEAKAQLDAIGALARGGDKSALASLPDAENAFLQSSKSRFSSTQKYGADYAYVQALNASLDTQFTQQLTVEEQILGVLQTSQDKLTEQVRILGIAASLLYAQLKAQTDYYIVGASAGPHQDPNFFGGWASQNPQFGGMFGIPLNGATGANPGLGSQSAFATFAQRHLDEDWTLESWRAAGSPAYASGGRFRGGTMLVGERGPELVRTGQASVDTREQFAAPIVTELRTLRKELAATNRKMEQLMADQTSAVKGVGRKEK